MSSADSIAIITRGLGASAGRDADSSGSLLLACWRQWRTELSLARRGIRFRSTDSNAVSTAYAAMSEQEFVAINGRQQWANGKTIPQALRNRLPNRELLVLDLGCGIGASTRVLARCCPEGSSFLAYENARTLLVHARRRMFFHADGSAANVEFVGQALDEPLRWPQGDVLGNKCVDLVHASGVFGHHFDVRTAVPVIREIRRVTVPGGLALLDDGPTLAADDLRRLMHDAGFEPLGRYRSWFGSPVGQTLFRRRGASTMLAPGSGKTKQK